MQLRNAQVEGFASFLRDFVNRELETVGIAFLARERAELATQDAVVGVVDVAIDNVAGTIPNLSVSGEISDCSHRVQVLALKEAERLILGNSLARCDLIIEIAQIAPLDEELHEIRLAEPAALAN
jgi:hypothetical protein